MVNVHTHDMDSWRSANEVHLAESGAEAGAAGGSGGALSSRGGAAARRQAAKGGGKGAKGRGQESEQRWMGVWQHVLTCSKDGAVAVHSVATAARPPRAIDPVVFALSPRGVMAAIHQPGFEEGATPPLRVHPLPLFAGQGAGVYRVSDKETLVGSRWGINDHSRSAHDVKPTEGEASTTSAVDGAMDGASAPVGGGTGKASAAPGAASTAAANPSGRKGSVKPTAAAVAARKAKAREDATPRRLRDGSKVAGSERSRKDGTSRRRVCR